MKNSEIFLGFSLGNKYFSEQNIEKYILTAYKHTKSSILIIIPDELHAVNYEVRNKYKRKRALKVSLRKGMDMINTINKIISKINNIKNINIYILRWKQIQENQEYNQLREKINKEFNENIIFKQKIIQVVKDNIKKDAYMIYQIEKLASYVLGELPILLQGFSYKNLNYTMHLYYKSSKLHELVSDIMQDSYYIEKFNLEIGKRVKFIYMLYSEMSILQP